MSVDNALLEIQKETLPELIEENIQFDGDTFLNKKDSQLFPEELKEKIREVNFPLDDDYDYKPVWSSGLWATSQGGKTYPHQSHAPFIEASYQRV
jgi:hypothetical protein